MDVSHDGRYVVSGGADGTMRLWDLKKRKEVHCQTIDGEFEFRSVAFSPDDREILIFGGTPDGKGWILKLWDVATGKNIATLKGHRARVRSLAFSPDGKKLVSCSSYPGKIGKAGKNIQLWEVATVVPLRC